MKKHLPSRASCANGDIILCLFDRYGRLPIRGVEFILDLAHLLGLENLLVEMHMRDGRAVCQNRGIAMMKDAYALCDTVQFCGNLCRLVFFAVVAEGLRGAKNTSDLLVAGRLLILDGILVRLVKDGASLIERALSNLCLLDRKRERRLHRFFDPEDQRPIACLAAER